jgi:hypothetical protein
VHKKPLYQLIVATVLLAIFPYLPKVARWPTRALIAIALGSALVLLIAWSWTHLRNPSKRFIFGVLAFTFGAAFSYALLEGGAWLILKVQDFSDKSLDLSSHQVVSINQMLDGKPSYTT